MAEQEATRPVARDLLDFDGENLYFDEPMSAEVARLLEIARLTPAPVARLEALQQAEALAPDDLTVIVALYRFYYFQHDFDNGLTLADKAMRAAARRLNVTADWRLLVAKDVERVGSGQMAMLRFYLWALKGRGYLLMRLGRLREALEPLQKLVELDSANRLNCQPLLALTLERLEEQEKEPPK